MLQAGKATPLIISEPVIGEPAGSGIVAPAEMLETVVGFVRRQLAVIAFAALAAFVLGLIYIIGTPSSYTATATLIIDTRKVQVFQQQSIIGDIPVDASLVESQLEILKSENVARAVIKKLNLMDDPEFGSSRGGLLSVAFNWGISLIDAAPSSEFVRQREAVRAFQDRIGIKRVGLSYVIEISFRSYSPEHAAQIANAIAEAYVQDQLGAKYEATRRASIWLQGRIQELRQQASAADKAVVDFKTKNNIVTTGGTGSRLVSEQQVAELNSQLVLIRAQTADARAKLDRIETVLRVDSPDATVNSTVTDTLKNEVITKLRSLYLELANREVDWSTRYGANHLAAVNLRNQMREIRKSIRDELQRISEGYKSDYQIAKAREAQIQNELAQAVAQSQETNQAQVALRDLESTSQTYKTLYDNFLQRYMESVQQQSFPISEARVISEASRPLRRSQPKTFLVFAIAAFGGLIVGFGLGLIRDVTDRKFRTIDQVEDALGTDCIAVVPLLKKLEVVADDRSKQARTANSKKTVSNPFERKESAPKTPLPPIRPPTFYRSSGTRIIAPDKSVWWEATNEPFSRYAEAIRSIKLAIDLNQATAIQPAKSKAVGFTSSIPNEGKSTLALALGQLIAQAGARVIVVDCDIRNPSITRKLTPTADIGLFEVIAGNTALNEAIWTVESTKMAFLPLATKTRVAHSSEILSSNAIKKLFDSLRESYDYVIADFSPLAPIIDVRATTKLVDSYVFVIEWGGTKIDVVEHALASARSVSANMLGAVLNKADMEVFGRYEGRHREDYYYNKKYTQYGYTD